MMDFFQISVVVLVSLDWIKSQKNFCHITFHFHVKAMFSLQIALIARNGKKKSDSKLFLQLEQTSATVFFLLLHG